MINLKGTFKMTKTLRIKPILTDEEADALFGTMLKDSDCKMLIDYDADVYDKDTGICIAKFRKGIIPGDICQLGYDNLLAAATKTDSRGIAGGKDEVDGKTSGLRINKGGIVSKQTIAKGFVNSGVAGFYDRSVRFPYCRLTAFTQHHMNKFQKAYPIIKFVDNTYKQLMPKEYKAQLKVAEASSQDFRIPNTAFSTITVNKNYNTAVHKDAGDFKGGFGNLTALRKGKYTGCYLVAVKWGVGFDLQNTDLLLMDVHQWHGNTPMVKVDQEATRLSLVMYLRENIRKCGTAKQELKRAQQRKKGDSL